MVALKLDVDQATYEWLVQRCVEGRRRVDWQAEVELQQAMKRSVRLAARREKRQREQLELYADLVETVVSGKVTLSALDPSRKNPYPEPETIVPGTVYRKIVTD
jgi:hypothetical protein